MGSMYSSVGLISGIDYETMIGQLLAIEAQPRERLAQRVSKLDAQRTALKDISARISAVVARLGQLKKPSFFNASKATSSNTDVLTISGADNVASGSYRFQVLSLAATHQMVSRGFASETAPVGSGVVTLESAAARATADTSLEALNGYQGVQRGKFKLTDAGGAEATIDISGATTVGDVLERINAAEVNVRASLSADGLVLEETTGGTLRIREVEGKHVAADLGFTAGNTYTTEGRLTGSTIRYLSAATPTSELRDGLGIRTARAGGDFTINGMTVDLSGLLGEQTRVQRLNHGNGIGEGSIKITTYDDEGTPSLATVDLTGIETMGEIKDRIEETVTSLNVTFADDRMLIGYKNNDGQRALEIEDVDGSIAADLNIAREAPAGTIDSRSLLPMDTTADILAAINYANNNDGSITASLADGALVINGGATTELAAVGSSHALRDLGFAEGTFGSTTTGERILGGLDGVLLSSLNGGRGFDTGLVRISVGDEELDLDLSDAATIGTVVTRLNQAFADAGVDAEAQLDTNGSRLLISSFDGLTPIRVQDLEGDFAATLGLDGEAGAPVLRSENLQRAYVNEATQLDSLLSGRGISLGTIKVTNTNGVSREINLSGSETVADVIRKINEHEDHGVSARVNDTGDGIVLEDTNDGTFDLEIEDVSGHAARDLNLAGEHSDGIADGSYELRIDLGSGMSLSELADAINDRSRLATASVLNDGTQVAPHRLQLTSRLAGARGELLIEGLDVSTLTQAQDARVVLGESANAGLVMTSSTNEFKNIVPGLDVELQSAADQPVTVNASQDVDALVAELEGLVKAYNTAVDRIAELSSYDSDTEERGILLSDGTTRMIERRMWNLVTNSRVSAAGEVRRIGDLGVSISNGKLVFAPDEFRQAFADDPDAVIDFFTTEETGFAKRMEETLKGITDIDGLVERRDDVLERQREDYVDRMETMTERLERSRLRMLRQFQAMETALAEMQAQQASVSQLSAFAGGFGM